MQRWHDTCLEAMHVALHPSAGRSGRIAAHAGIGQRAGATVRAGAGARRDLAGCQLRARRPDGSEAAGAVAVAAAGFGIGRCRARPCRLREREFAHHQPGRELQSVGRAAHAALLRQCGSSCGCTLSQTLWSFQAFSQLKEANLQAAAAEASFRRAPSRTCCCAWRRPTSGFCRPPISSPTNRRRARRLRHAAEPGQDARADRRRPAQRRRSRRRPSTMRPNKASSMRSNALDDANLALTEIVGPHDRRRRAAARGHSIGVARAGVGRRMGGLRAAGQLRRAHRGAQDGGGANATSRRSAAAALPTFRCSPARAPRSPRTRCSAAIRRLDTVGVVLQLAAVPGRRGGLGGAPVARALPASAGAATTRRSAMPSARPAPRFAASSRGIPRIGAAAARGASPDRTRWRRAAAMSSSAPAPSSIC